MINIKSNLLNSDELFIVEKISNTIIQKKKHLLGLNFDPWSFDRPERLGIVLAIFLKFGIPSLLGIEVGEILDLILLIENTYNNVPYHSFCHAVDVFVKSFYLLDDLKMSNYLTSFDILVLLICSLAHDSELAMKYPNSTLESYSIDLVLGFINELSLFRNIMDISDPIYVDSSISAKTVVDAIFQQITQAILFTDMAHHFEVVSMCSEVLDFLSKKLLYLNINPGFEQDDKLSKHKSEIAPSSPFSFLKMIDMESISENYHLRNYPHTPKNSEDHISIIEANKKNRPLSLSTGDMLLDSKNRFKLVTVMLHAVDIFNPILPWNLCKKWSTLMMNEFIAQGDLEKRKCLQVTPSMDRATYNQSRTSIDFATIVILPFFNEFVSLIPVKDEMISSLSKNILCWKAIDQSKDEAAEKSKPTSLETQIEKFPLKGKNYADLSLHNQHLKISAPDQTKKLSVAAGTLEIPTNDYYSKKFRRYSNDDADNFIRGKIGMLFSGKLQQVENRRKLNKRGESVELRSTFFKNREVLSNNHSKLTYLRNGSMPLAVKLRRTQSEGSNLFSKKDNFSTRQSPVSELSGKNVFNVPYFR
ncbi:hypothetical protein BB560_000661 [Smittium megazygosporum]|uniref:PDEase domain-containing protein n=1 Tax=Smittium megazygosporum TaxID=133381 RepID=A0A2T9ZJM9_9FUNG|nr:hypothetical protein BB560_000661 [Smittium megazygosporum]